MKHGLKFILCMLMSCCIPLKASDCNVSFDSTKSMSPILTCEVIIQLDGKSYGFSGVRIGSMIQIEIRISNMLYGTRQKDSDIRIGSFEFQGKLYSIVELINIEKQLVENTNCFSAEEHKRQTKELAELLEKAKNIFVSTVKPFIDQARGVKPQTTMIINEWIEKTNNPESPLRDWAHTEEGKELDLFYRDTTSFGRFSVYCSDLIHFFDSLIKSCSEGMKQFEKLKEQYNAQHRD